MTTAAFPKLHPHEMWMVFNDHEPFVIEIRSIWPKGITPSQRTLSRCFDQSQYKDTAVFRAAVEVHVTQMNKLGYNLYATLNPIKVGIGSNTAASDDDIRCRRRLLIDIDRDHGKDHPASESEIEEAKNLGDAIVRHLSALGWAAPVRVMSGNGHHLIYALGDLANSKDVTRTIRNFLHNLKQTFSANGMSVDTSVSNASRVTKLPGTLARRGTELENHPYRIARIYE